MDAQQYLPRVPRDIKFRVLVIGRANAGMTSILQRVCDTTDSPEIYRVGQRGQRQRVRLRSYCHFRSQHLARFDSTLQWRLGRLMLVSCG